jgi:hypothetical protein
MLEARLSLVHLHKTDHTCAYYYFRAWNLTRFRSHTLYKLTILVLIITPELGILQDFARTFYMN